MCFVDKTHSTTKLADKAGEHSTTDNRRTAHGVAEGAGAGADVKPKVNFIARAAKR